MKNFLYTLLTIISLTNCSPDDPMDSQRRNSKYAWIEENGSGRWEKLGGEDQIEHGQYTLFYDNSNKRESGHIQNSQNIDSTLYYDTTGTLVSWHNLATNVYRAYRTGKHEVFHGNGKIRMKGNFRSLVDGDLTTYYENGQKASEYKLKDGLINGIYQSFHQNGNPKEYKTYYNGLLDGLTRFYFKNGQVAQQVNFDNDYREGTQLSYHENGELYKSTFWRNNLREGPVIEKFPNGSLRLEGNYRNDKFDGVFKHYYMNGNTYSISNYKKGKPHGKAIIYGSMNGLYQEIIYENGEIISQETKRELTDKETEDFKSIHSYSSKLISDYKSKVE